jgi:hypothetical protein
MNRGYLALGAAVVLAAIIGLYVASRRGDDGEPQLASSDPKIAQADPGKSSSNGTRPAPSVTVPPPGAGSTTVVNDYMIGDVHVRDHRTGDHAPLDVPPAIHAPGGRKVPSELVSDIAQKVRAVVAACAASLPIANGPGGRGEKPRADGEIMIAIKNQLATVTSATIQLRDVEGATVESVKQCIEQKSIGIATASGDEPDLEGYAITTSFRLP